MSTQFRPTEDTQVCDVVAWAVSEGTPIEVVGHGTKGGLGRAVNLSATLDTSDLTGITFYEASELALTARAGTPLAEVEAVLAKHDQQLAFEPPDLGPLFGAPAGEATIGGIVACNLSGPRRVKAGAARDHFLGVSAVSGRGELFKSGGRVVKNVSGYDLCKVMAGSYGTLAVLTDITLKVLPAPEKTRTILASGLDDAVAISALGEAARSTFEPSAMAHLPAVVAKRSDVSYVADAGAAVTAVRIEGTEASVLYRCQRLRELLGRHGAVEELHGRNSGAFWRGLGNVTPFVADADRAVWRVSVPPAAAAAIVADVASACDAEWYYDWAGGLIWLSIGPNGNDGGAAAIRGAIAQAGQGGHATLVRGDGELRARIPVFQPQPAPLAALSARLKDQFDPRGVLNPGRMVSEG